MCFSILSQIRMTLSVDNLGFNWDVYKYCKETNTLFEFFITSSIKPAVKLFIQGKEAIRLVDRFRNLKNREQTLDIEFICIDFSDKYGFIVETWQEIVN